MAINIAFVPGNKRLLNNSIFDISSGRDQVFQPFSLLRFELEKVGYSLNTFDVAGNNISIILVMGIDANFGNLLRIIKKNPTTKVILLVNEERTISPYHTKEILKSRLFDLVLTWDDSIIDGSYFLKYNYPNAKLMFQSEIPFSDKKLLTMINSFKKSSKNIYGELYSKRTKIAEYFSDKEFDLYGEGWENSNSASIQKCFKGAVDSKAATLKNYKFSITFENTSNELGAITEKIFDSFSAGCVPVYFGAPNVKDYIPENCFIDYRNFNNFDGLYSYLSSMNDNTYDTYQKAIKKFMESTDYDSFNSIGFVKTIRSAINIVEKIPLTRRETFKIRLEWIQKVFRNINIFYDRKRLLLELWL